MEYWGDCAEFERCVGEVDSIPRVLEAQSSHMLLDCVREVSVETSLQSWRVEGFSVSFPQDRQGLFVLFCVVT